MKRPDAGRGAGRTSNPAGRHPGTPDGVGERGPGNLPGRYGAQRPGRPSRPAERPAAPAEGLGGEQVEGYHAVYRLIDAQRRRCRLLWADARLAAGPLRELVSLARQRGVQVELKEAHQLATASRTSSAQGVLAWADPLPAVPLEAMLSSSAGLLLLVLDGVTDPGNLGSILRSAACAGTAGVVVGRHRSAPLNPAALKAAAGAAETLPVAQVPGIPSALAAIRSAGLWVVGLDPAAEDDLWASPLLDESVALVLGSEGQGLSRLSRARCDALARIPMSEAARGVGSLNVAAACAVACFEVARRRSLALPPRHAR